MNRAVLRGDHGGGWCYCCCCLLLLSSQDDIHDGASVGRRDEYAGNDDVWVFLFFFRNTRHAIPWRCFVAFRAGACELLIYIYITVCRPCRVILSAGSLFRARTHPNPPPLSLKIRFSVFSCLTYPPPLLPIPIKPEQNLELLDSPGIIPARQEDQHQALKLAICNDIGQASYDTQVRHQTPLSEWTRGAFFWCYFCGRTRCPPLPC